MDNDWFMYLMVNGTFTLPHSPIFFQSPTRGIPNAINLKLGDGLGHTSPTVVGVEVSNNGI